MLSLLASCLLVFESFIYGQQLPAGECCAHSSLKLKILLAYCTILEGENTIYRPVWAVQMYDPARLKSGTRQAHLIPQRCIGLVLRGSKVCSYFFHFLFDRSFKLFSCTFYWYSCWPFIVAFQISDYLWITKYLSFWSCKPIVLLLLNHNR